MSDVKSEEFRRFILENRKIIETILREDSESDDKKKDKGLFDEKLEEAKERTKSAGDDILRIVSDDDVQKHFITGCLEFLHFFEAVIEAAPLSPEVREAIDKFEHTRDTTIRNVVVTGAKDKMESITINDVKSETPAKKTAKPKKAESVPISDGKKRTKSA